MGADTDNRIFNGSHLPKPNPEIVRGNKKVITLLCGNGDTLESFVRKLSKRTGTRLDWHFYYIARAWVFIHPDDVSKSQTVIGRAYTLGKERDFSSIKIEESPSDKLTRFFGVVLAGSR